MGYNNNIHFNNFLFYTIKTLGGAITFGKQRFKQYDLNRA